MCSAISWKSVVYYSIEHADNTVVLFRNKVCFEIWKKCVGNLTDFLL